MKTPVRIRWAALACLALLASCSGTPHESKRLVATVNGHGISASRVAAAVERAGARGDQRSPEAVLERLIDQELLAQAALARGLDRQPPVRQAIEDARSSVLAHAYLQSLTGTAAPAPQEVENFYSHNPALFARRRIFRLRKLVLEVESVPGLKERITEGASLDELAGWLKGHGVAFQRTNQTQPSEELPLVFLSRIARMQPGEVALLSAEGAASVVQLLGFEDAPLTGAQAAPLIGQFLSARRRVELAQQEIARLRGNARIEYAGRPGTRTLPTTGMARRTSAEVAWAGAPARDEHTTNLRGRN